MFKLTNPIPLPSLCGHAGLVCICLNFGSNIKFLGFSKIITVFYCETQTTTNTRNIYVANVAGSCVWETMRMNELQSNDHSSHGFSCTHPPSPPPPPPPKKKHTHTHTHIHTHTPARQDNIYAMLCCKQKPIRRSIKTKLQVTMLIGLWFCGFLACQDFVVLGHNTLTIPEIF